MNCFEKFILHHQKFMIDSLGGAIETLMFNQAMANAANPTLAVSIEDARQIVEGYAAPHIGSMNAVFGSVFHTKNKKGVNVHPLGLVAMPKKENLGDVAVNLDIDSLGADDHIGKAIAMADEAILVSLCNREYNCRLVDVEKLIKGADFDTAVRPIGDKKLGRKVSRFLFESEPIGKTKVFCHSLLKNSMFLFNNKDINLMVSVPALKCDPEDSNVIQSIFSVDGKVGKTLLVRLM